MTSEEAVNLNKHELVGMIPHLRRMIKSWDELYYERTHFLEAHKEELNKFSKVELVDVIFLLIERVEIYSFQCGECYHLRKRPKGVTVLEFCRNCTWTWGDWALLMYN